MLRRRLLFSQTEQKNLLDDDAFDVSNVFFSSQRAGLNQVRQNYIAKNVLE